MGFQALIPMLMGAMGSGAAGGAAGGSAAGAGAAGGSAAGAAGAGAMGSMGGKLDPLNVASMPKKLLDAIDYLKTAGMKLEGPELKHSPLGAQTGAQMSEPELKRLMGGY